ncbi:MAG: PD-(D/E)XK nuclease family protein [Deltaproteobacteria bacterium]|nr:PD-(D/E)XK nuclease family protein [Deltaproteobacteria bacterium]
MAELRNTFSWSHSRRGVFETCLRRYFLVYYGSWGGWEATAPPAVREAWIQKRLTTLPMWIGTLVHEAAEEALKALCHGRPVVPDTLLARSRARAAHQVQESASGAALRASGKATVFQEHYYREPIPDGAWDAAIEEVGRQIRTFLADPVYLRLCQVPDRLMEVESLEQVDVEGVPVWVKLDALVSDGRGGCVIVDWKTGAAHDSDAIGEQLGVYGLYCQIHHGIPPSDLVAMHVNLRYGTRAQHRVDDQTLEATRRTIATSACAMRSLLEDPSRNVASRERFPMLPLGDPTCRGCPFRRTCGRETSD